MLVYVTASVGEHTLKLVTIAVIESVLPKANAFFPFPFCLAYSAIHPLHVF